MLESWATSRYKFLAEFLDLTFDFGFAAGWVSNVKSTPLDHFFVSRYFHLRRRNTMQHVRFCQMGAPSGKMSPSLRSDSLSTASAAKILTKSSCSIPLSS